MVYGAFDHGRDYVDSEERGKIVAYDAVRHCKCSLGNAI